MTAEPSTPLKTVSPTRLVDDVVRHLRAYIADNDLADGDRLPSERTLASEMGTSRATVSQALRVLSVMGLVEIRHGSGIYVRRHPAAMFGTTFDLMIDLEPETAGQLAEFRYLLERGALLGDEPAAVDIERLRRDLVALESSKSRLESWIEADADFHMSLISCSDNQYLRATYEMAHRKILSVTYAEWIERGSSPSWLRGNGWENQLALHHNILAAAEAGDATRLQDALAEHQTELMRHLARAVDLPV